MKNVKLIKGKRGYFLTIGKIEKGIANTWAVTSFELLTLLKLLKDHEKEFKNEIDLIKDEEGLSYET